MSQYIPPECVQFLNVCTTSEVCWGYFFAGVVATLAFILVALWVMSIRGLRV